jgi:hypothetical protein
MIPMIMKIHIQERGKKKIRLWIPMFLIWLLLFAFMIVLSPIFILIGIVAWIRGYGKIFLFAIPMIFAVLWAMSGLRIHIEDKDKRIQFIAV